MLEPEIPRKRIRYPTFYVDDSALEIGRKWEPRFEAPNCTVLQLTLVHR